MLNKKMIKLMNEQINKELESAYLYLDFVNYFTEKELNGFAHWYKVQAQEEIEHAEKFMDYLHDENEKVVLTPIDKVKCNCKDDLTVLHAGLEHEIYITRLIHELYAEAEKHKDYRSLKFLDWFVNEQAEEEKNANELINRYEMFAEGSKEGLYQLDHELGER